jgi:lauroyl/myristoyl acyltransferase
MQVKTICQGIILCLVNILLLPFYLVCGLLCGILSFLPIFPTKVALENLMGRLGVSRGRARWLITRMYMGYVFYTLEALIFEPLGIVVCLESADCDLKALHQKLESQYGERALSHPERPLAERRPEVPQFVYLSGHMANIELNAAPMVVLNPLLGYGPLCAVAKPTRRAWLNRLLAWYRRRQGLNLVWADAALFRNLHRAVHDHGHSLCLLVDQKPQGGSAGQVFLPFFGKLAAFPTSGLRYALSCRLVVVYGAMKRIFPGWLRVHMSAGYNGHLGAAASAQTSKDFFAIQELEHFAVWYEGEIRKNPAQWSWDYKKWSRAPPPTPTVSADGLSR